MRRPTLRVRWPTKENAVSCYMCLPTCDNCRPKMVTCPSCGAMTLIDLKTCPLCKQSLTEEAKEQAWAAWRTKHAQEE